MVQRISIALAIALAGTAVWAPCLTAHPQRAISYFGGKLDIRHRRVSGQRPGTAGAILREAERNRRAYDAAQRRKFEDDLKTLSEIADELAVLNEPLDTTELKTIREAGREIDKRIDRIIDYLGVDANPRRDPLVAPPSDINVDSIRQLVNMLSRARRRLIRVAMDRTVLDLVALREVVGDLETVQLFNQPFKNAGQ